MADVIVRHLLERAALKLEGMVGADALSSGVEESCKGAQEDETLVEAK